MILDFDHAWRLRMSVSISTHMMREAGRLQLEAAKLAVGTQALALAHIGDLMGALADRVQLEFGRTAGSVVIELREAEL